MLAKQGIKQAVSVEEILTLGIEQLRKTIFASKKTGLRQLGILLMRLKYLTVRLAYAIVVPNSEKERSSYLHICLVLGPKIETY